MQFWPPRRRVRTRLSAQRSGYLSGAASSPRGAGRLTLPTGSYGRLLAHPGGLDRGRRRTVSNPAPLSRTVSPLPRRPPPPPTAGVLGVVESDRAVIAVGESLQGGENEAEPERGVEVVGAAMQPGDEQSVRVFKASAIPGLLDELFDRPITVGLLGEADRGLGDRRDAVRGHFRLG